MDFIDFLDFNDFDGMDSYRDRVQNFRKKYGFSKAFRRKIIDIVKEDQSIQTNCIALHFAFMW